MVRVYPNPTNGKLFVSAAQGSDITILDMNGRMLVQSEGTDSEMSFDLAHIAAGTYLVRIVQEGNISIERFVKE
jgi:hypothetical protein